jgi:hypothetical protein
MLVPLPRSVESLGVSTVDEVNDDGATISVRREANRERPPRAVRADEHVDIEAIAIASPETRDNSLVEAAQANALDWARAAQQAPSGQQLL